MRALSLKLTSTFLQLLNILFALLMALSPWKLSRSVAPRFEMLCPDIKLIREQKGLKDEQGVQGIKQTNSHWKCKHK